MNSVIMVRPDYRLLAGIAIPIVFGFSILALATLVDGYSHVSQTVSEIGEAGSPAEIPWKIANFLIAMGFLAFASGIYRFARASAVSVWPAYLVGYFGLMSIGMSTFESPHPLHNVFGLSLTLGYMAPLVMALSWRKQAWAGSVVNYSWVSWVLVVIAIFLNLTPAFARDLYPLEYYGLVQRSLFLVFYGFWCSVISWKLYKISS